MGKSTICGIIRETCQAIWDALKDQVLAPPDKDKWLDIANDFFDTWNFPNCLGAIDGKHIMLRAPPKSGTMYRNYKSQFSIVLMAVADAKYRFTLVDIGAYGSNSDGGVWKHSDIGQAFDNNELDMPVSAPIPGYTDEHFPFVLVGDEAFPLKENLMRPFPGRGTMIRMPPDEDTFNYRLSRARRVVENAFGILAQRWQLFLSTVTQHPDNAQLATQAALVLHNYLQKDGVGLGTLRRQLPAPPCESGAAPRSDEMVRLQGMGHRSGHLPKQVRMRFAKYFRSASGNLEFQDKYRLLQ